MELASAGPHAFRLRGECPHCRYLAAFSPVTQSFIAEGETIGTSRMIAALRCEACHEFILGILSQTPEPGRSSSYVWRYQTHYPLGAANDDVPLEVPEKCKERFSGGYSVSKRRLNRGRCAHVQTVLADQLQRAESRRQKPFQPN